MAAKASHEAKGPATRLQWLSSEFNLLADIASPVAKGRMPIVLAEIYQQAFSLPDGFKGRNRKHLETVGRKVSSLPADHPVVAIQREFLGKCEELGADQRKDCIEVLQI
jgi:hypothetical protein